MLAPNWLLAHCPPLFARGTELLQTDKPFCRRRPAPKALALLAGQALPWPNDGGTELVNGALPTFRPGDWAPVNESKIKSLKKAFFNCNGITGADIVTEINPAALG
jgi:hypothetical protein